MVTTPRTHYCQERTPVPIVQEAGWVPGTWRIVSLTRPPAFELRTVQPVACRHNFCAFTYKNWLDFERIDPLKVGPPRCVRREPIMQWRHVVSEEDLCWAGPHSVIGIWLFTGMYKLNLRPQGGKNLLGSVDVCTDSAFHVIRFWKVGGRCVNWTAVWMTQITVVELAAPSDRKHSVHPRRF
jgi:hypothetical protein